jgi:hypothetical protein
MGFSPEATSLAMSSSGTVACARLIGYRLHPRGVRTFSSLFRSLGFGLKIVRPLPELASYIVPNGDQNQFSATRR